jgi:hypothetical protein
MSNNISYDTVMGNLNSITNKCNTTKFTPGFNYCYTGATLDATGIKKCFGPDPNNNPQNNKNEKGQSATDAYTNAVLAYQNVMDTYLNTTTSELSNSQLIALQQQLDASFSAAIKPGLYETVFSNLTNFTNSINSTFDKDCAPTTRLDASGIYKCFGEGEGGSYITSPLGQLQSSCQTALRVATENQDVADLPTLYKNCSGFFRNNLANTVSDISQNINGLISYNETVISNNTYYTDLLNTAKNQTCKQNSPIILPVSNLINNTLTTYNETVSPYLDTLITELTQIKENLPNTIVIGKIQQGSPGSSPYITLSPVNGINSQTMNITVAQGNQGPRGPTGIQGSNGAQGIPGAPGVQGNKGVVGQPIQYESVF